MDAARWLEKCSKISKKTFAGLFCEKSYTKMELTMKRQVRWRRIRCYVIGKGFLGLAVEKIMFLVKTCSLLNNVKTCSMMSELVEWCCIYSCEWRWNIYVEWCWICMWSVSQIWNSIVCEICIRDSKFEFWIFLNRLR